MGSNRGNSKEFLARAVELLHGLEGISVAAASKVYLTEPQEKSDQPWFANQVVELECGAEVTPRRLLASLQAIESELGRDRESEERFGPRTMDIDILLFGDVRTGEGELTIPHPRMAARAFVLVPLAEIAPELSLPDGTGVGRLLDALEYRKENDRIWQSAAMNQAHAESKPQQTTTNPDKGR